MLIAPSSGFEHRFPVDCWRFYRDGMVAIADFLGFEVLDTFTDWGRPLRDDSVLVMRKPLWSPAERRAFMQRRWHQHMAADPAGCAALVNEAIGDNPAERRSAGCKVAG